MSAQLRFRFLELHATLKVTTRNGQTQAQLVAVRRAELTVELIDDIESVDQPLAGAGR